MEQFRSISSFPQIYGHCTFSYSFLANIFPSFGKKTNEYIVSKVFVKNLLRTDKRRADPISLDLALKWPSNMIQICKMSFRKLIKVIIFIVLLVNPSNQDTSQYKKNWIAPNITVSFWDWNLNTVNVHKMQGYL